MTPQEIRDACKTLKGKIGPDAYVSVDVGTGGFTACIYTKGVGHSDRDDVSEFKIRVGYEKRYETFADILTDLESEWRAEVEKRNGRAVEEMALEIIRLTAEFGECTDRALRAKYGPLVATLSEAAVTRANEMAANGPFKVLLTVAANAA